MSGTWLHFGLAEPPALARSGFSGLSPSPSCLSALVPLSVLWNHWISGQEGLSLIPEEAEGQ